MCGRFSFQPSPEMAKILKENLLEAFATGAVIVPGMDILTYQNNGFKIAKWGFKPSWVQNDFKASTHNARSETVHEKATYRDAWGNGQRCVIPASSFIEWPKEGGRGKQGYEITSMTHSHLFFAGLWDTNQHGHQCTILTKSAGNNLSTVHPRMPAMIKRHNLKEFLAGSIPQAQNLIQKADESDLKMEKFFEKNEKTTADLFS